MVKYIVQLRGIVCFSESSQWNSNEIVLRDCWKSTYWCTFYSKKFSSRFIPPIFV